MKKLSCIYIIGIGIRLLFFIIGIVWDYFYQYKQFGIGIRYTDIDYDVFTDAAILTYQGAINGPYERVTYRYSPIISFLMIPFVSISSSFIIWHFGKLIFIIVDIINIYLTQQIIIMNNSSSSSSSSIWIWFSVLNPMSINIATRGSADSVINMLILLLIFLLKKKSQVNESLMVIALAGFIFGFSIHLRIYPIIYIFSFCFYLVDIEYYNLKNILILYWNKSNGINNNNNNNNNNNKYMEMKICSLIIFLLMSLVSFFILSGIFYILYGEEYLENAFYYHIFRKDHRHNFSIYFYNVYLSYGHSYHSFLKILPFIPQLILMVATSLHLARKDLSLCIFLQTFIFVTFNKVSTAQYFTWYMSLIPIVLSNAESMKYTIYKKSFIYIVTFWIVSLIYWLLIAYYLEIFGINLFLQLYFGATLFHLSSTLLIIYIIINTSNSIMIFN
jgi:phosphatidylinositol glycan class M